MANKSATRKTTQQQQAIDADLIANLIEADDEREMLIEEFVSKFGARTGKVSIYRVEKNGEPAFKGSYPPDSVNEQFLQDEFGEGRYLIKLLDESGRWMKQRPLLIGAPPVRPLAPTAAHPAGNLAETLFKMQLDNMRESMERERQASQRQHDLLLKVIERNNGGGSSGTSLTDLLAMFKTVKELAGGGSPLSSVKELLEVAELLGGSGKEDNGWSALKEVLPALGQAFLTTQRHASVPGATIAPGRPAGVSAAPAVAAIPASVGSDPQKALELFKVMLTKLKAKAIANQDPEFWAEYLVMNGDEPEVAAFCGGVVTYPFDVWMQFDPELTQPQFRTWFEQLYNEVKDELANPENSTRRSGNADYVGRSSAEGAGLGSPSVGAQPSDEAVGSAVPVG